MYSFPNLEPVCCSMSGSNCCFWHAYRFLRRQVRWSVIFHLLKNFPRFVAIHTVKGFGIVNKAEADIFRELSCFFDDQWMLAIWSLVPLPFSKSSLNIWKFSVHVLLKHRLENFEHYFASMWNDCNCWLVRTIFGIALPFFEIGMKTDLL